MSKSLIAICIIVSMNCFSGIKSPFDPMGTIARITEPNELVFTFTSTKPASITLGSSCESPAIATNAYFDAGSGWQVYTGKTIALLTNVLKFKGNWKTATGRFNNMFYNTFNTTNKVIMTGKLDVSGSYSGSMFENTFFGCSAITGSIPSKLFGNLTGAPDVNMFAYTFRGFSGISKPIQSGLFGSISGTPATSMFAQTFYGCSKLVGPLPSGLFGNLTGAPSSDMFNSTFGECYELNGDIPSGLFGNLSGTPSTSMFVATFSGRTKLAGQSALMPNGTTHLYEQFPTATGTHVGTCYLNCTSLADYSSISNAWKY